MTERTLAIIKPDAVQKRAIGAIIRHYEDAGLTPVAIRMLRMSQATAEEFYAIHQARPFFKALTAYMSSGHSVVLVLEGENAVAVNRTLMGATDPRKAEPGTIRAVHGASLEANAVHGSDSRETAGVEIAYFFPDLAPYV